MRRHADQAVRGREWFSKVRDTLLDRELGPMDTDWLDAVFAESNGVPLVASIQREPVGLIGCVWGLDWQGHPPTAK
jgi:hypothetical protein